MSNATGTLFRISGLILLLMFGWFALIGFLYFLLSLILGFSFDMTTLVIIFILFLSIKAFYPKNVFR